MRCLRGCMGYADVRSFGRYNPLLRNQRRENQRAGARLALPPVITASGEQEDVDDWEASVHASGPSNVIVQDVVYAPGGHTGWHSHPGILLSSVIAGSLEWYDSKCRLHVYNAGASFSENTQLHYARNVGTENVHFMVTYMIAAGQPRRIDQPAPACAAALGLN